jgi:hypothetical protein
MDDETRAFQARIEAILPTLTTKAEMEALRAEVLKIANETHKWMLASVIGMFIGFGGLFMAVKGDEKPVARTETPIVIVIPAESIRQKE